MHPWFTVREAYPKVRQLQETAGINSLLSKTGRQLIDDNFHNYLYKEHAELNGGIEGGIGVFGSVCGFKYDLLVNGR